MYLGDGHVGTTVLILWNYCYFLLFSALRTKPRALYHWARFCRLTLKHSLTRQEWTCHCFQPPSAGIACTTTPVLKGKFPTHFQHVTRDSTLLRCYIYICRGCSEMLKKRSDPKSPQFGKWNGRVQSNTSTAPFRKCIFFSSPSAGDWSKGLCTCYIPRKLSSPLRSLIKMPRLSWNLQSLPASDYQSAGITVVFHYAGSNGKFYSGERVFWDKVCMSGLAFNSQWSYFSFHSAGITDVCHYAQENCKLFTKHFVLK